MNENKNGNNDKTKQNNVESCHLEVIDSDGSENESENKNDNNDKTQYRTPEYLKQLRDKRRLRRREKRRQKAKELEKKRLELLFGIQDTRVKVISQDTANKIKETNAANQFLPSCSLDIANGYKLESEWSQTRNFSYYANVPTNFKRGKSDLVQIDIADALKPESPTKPKTKDSVPKIQYSGNILDSDQPQRKKGKQREVSKKKNLSKLKTQILREKRLQDTKSDYENIHSPHFETYCTNCVTTELDEAVDLFLTTIVKFQNKYFEREPVKGAIKRRYVVGLREVQKYLMTHKLKFIIIAPNIKTSPKNGALDNTVQNLIYLAEENNIPYVFALTRRIIGRITLKHIPVSCVGIFNYDGAEDIYKTVLKQLEAAKNLYSTLTYCPQNIQKDLAEQLAENLLCQLKL